MLVKGATGVSLPVLEISVYQNAMLVPVRQLTLSFVFPASEQRDLKYDSTNALPLSNIDLYRVQYNRYDCVSLMLFPVTVW